MGRIESKFNPDDWNGYLHTYETIAEYNAAKKLLPHVARIESTKEAKYTSRTQAELPRLLMEVDNINRGGGDKPLHEGEGEFDTIDEYISYYDEYGFTTDKTYKLVGEISIGVNKFYLWELHRWSDTEFIEFRRYVITDTIEQGLHIVDHSDPSRVKKCHLISINDDSEIERYDTSTDYVQIICKNGVASNNIIYDIYAEP